VIELTRAGEFYRHISDDPDVRVKRLLSDWADVLKDPDNPTKIFLGHPYRRWSSFARSSPLQELSRTNARIYIAQGSDDHAVTFAVGRSAARGLGGFREGRHGRFRDGRRPQLQYRRESGPGLARGDAAHSRLVSDAEQTR
jgi:hypothetical protein